MLRRGKAPLFGITTYLQPFFPLIPRSTIIWLVLRRAGKRATESRPLLADLRDRSPTLKEVTALAKAVTTLVRNRAPARFDA